MGNPDTPPAGGHAIFPGTFDPVTLGHLDVLERALGLFERVTIAVAAHHDKHAIFDLEERLRLLSEVTEAGEPLGRARVVALEGLLVEGCRRLGARAIVRGVRSAGDLEYERQMALTNRVLAPEIETVLLLSAPEHAHVSSTLVRQIARMGGDVSSFVPPAVRTALANR
ncbi:MAG: pantetheine-phosphate adenylyltransferase [bacterium]|nr:pantetheine-phosphate adenylyltransferase [bacterium]